MMKNFNKIISNMAKVITKIVEVFQWVGVGLMFAAVITAIASPSLVGKFISYDAKECCGADLSVYGLEIHAAVTNGKIDTAAFCIFGVGAVLVLSLMAMIFRNLHLIIKNSNDKTPFQRDNVRMFSEIGIFSFAVPVVGFLISIIGRIVIGVETAEISNSFEGFVVGIVVLCMTQYFVHGIELEEDVDGLL